MVFEEFYLVAFLVFDEVVAGDGHGADNFFDGLLIPDDLGIFVEVGGSEQGFVDFAASVPVGAVGIEAGDVDGLGGMSGATEAATHFFDEFHEEFGELFGVVGLLG